MHRARHALVELGERMGDGLAAGGIVAAIEPDLGPLPGISVESAVAEALKPRFAALVPASGSRDE